MKCLYCGKALALAEKLKFHDFCSANHQKAYVTERDWAEFQHRLHPKDDDEAPFASMAGLEPWHPTVNPHEGRLTAMGGATSPALMPIDPVVPRLAAVAMGGQCAPMSANAPLPAVRVAATRVRLRFAEMGFNERYYPALEQVAAPEEPWLAPMAGVVPCGPSLRNTAREIQINSPGELVPVSVSILLLRVAEQPKPLTIAAQLRMVPLSIRLRKTPGTPLFVLSEGQARHA